MSFPPLGTTVPTLEPFQFEFGGYVFGAFTDFELLKIEGLDLPTVRTGDGDRPRDHGKFIGLDLLAGREITISGQLRGNVVEFGAALEALSHATVPGGTTEVPLFFRLPYYGTLASMVRVRKRAMPIDLQFALGNLADITLLFAGSDPRLYGTTLSESVKPPASLPGFSFPLKFPFSFGGGSLVASMTVTNAGDIEMRPLLVVEGPCEAPVITNASAAEEPSLSFNLIIAAGDKLVLDTDMHTATYYVAGTTEGTSRLYTLRAGSRWFGLEPGANTLHFLSGNGEGTLECQYASAYLI